jgi:NAD(P)-dependent dehydrogenase (short-subunit alcohol dehydrogenase family)
VSRCSRDAAAVDAAASQLRALGHDAIGVVADKSRDGEVEAAEASGRSGGIDILVNGVAKVGGPPAGLMDLDDGDLRFEMETRARVPNARHRRCPRPGTPRMLSTARRTSPAAPLPALWAGVRRGRSCRCCSATP